MIYDLCVIGGGIVGLATAMEYLNARPGAGVVVLDKQETIAFHQTGHNSGVIHAGVYYKPGSLKAELCRRGAEATIQFCYDHNVPVQKPGKLIVATSELEMSRLDGLRQNALANGIDVETIDGRELRQREPNISGIGALFVKGSAIVDYRRVCKAMSNVVKRAGGSVQLGIDVNGIVEGPSDVTITSGDKQWTTRKLIVCAGLQSDRLAKLAGLAIDYQVIPFRGEYYDVVPEKRKIVSHLIYPVPDPELPFLGIHLTPMINGDLTVGPNAVLGYSREGYHKYSFKLADVGEYARFPGFWNMVRENWKSGLMEWRNSISKSHYLKECQKYCPSLEKRDLLSREAGIRAQAVTRKGQLVHDFLFLQTSRMLHVCNAPSPAATSAIPIAQMIIAKGAGI